MKKNETRCKKNAPKENINDKVQNAVKLERVKTVSQNATEIASAIFDKEMRKYVFFCWKTALRFKPLSTAEEKTQFLRNLRNAYKATNGFTICLTGESAKTDDQGNIVERYTEFATLPDGQKYYQKTAVCTISGVRASYNSFDAYKSAIKSAQKKMDNAELFEKVTAILATTGVKVDKLGLSTIRDLLAHS